MNIALASDHAGFEQAKELAIYLESQGHQCKNFGPSRLNPDDDYPDYVFKAAKAVASGEFERAVIIGGSGEGEAMAANRFLGIRCAVFYGPAVPRKVVDVTGRVSHDPYEILKLSREHNNSNALSLGARFLSLADMKYAINLWLDTPFSEEPRHSRRNRELDEGRA